MKNHKASQNQGNDPAASFAARLRELRLQAGSPSFRELSKITHYSSSALAAASSGKRLPSEAVLRAFVTGCGAEPDEWLILLRQAARAASAAGPTPARRRLLGYKRSLPVVIGGGACVLLASGGIIGAAIQHGQDKLPVPAKNHTTVPTRKTEKAADGSDPVTAGCVADARLVDKSAVMLDGRQIGALELKYSARCAAGWARIYLYPGEPSMLGEVTVEASDGRLVAFANPLVKQVAVYTDVIALASGECLSAHAIFYPAAHPPIRARISCQAAVS